MKKKLYLLIAFVLFLLMLAFLKGQDSLTVDVFDNGYLVKRDTTQIAFIYQGFIFGMSGDTLKILMKKDQQ